MKNKFNLVKYEGNEYHGYAVIENSEHKCNAVYFNPDDVYEFCENNNVDYYDDFETGLIGEINSSNYEPFFEEWYDRIELPDIYSDEHIFSAQQGDNEYLIRLGDYDGEWSVLKPMEPYTDDEILEILCKYDSRDINPHKVIQQFNIDIDALEDEGYKDEIINLLNSREKE